MRLCVLVVILVMLVGSVRVEADVPTSLPSDLGYVLRYVPDDAHLVVIIPNLARLTEGVAEFGERAGLKKLAGMTAKGVFRDTLGAHANALDQEGAVVLAVSADDDDALLIANLASADVWLNESSPIRFRDDVLLFEFDTDRYVAAATGRVAIFGREPATLRRALDSTRRFERRFHREAEGALDGRQMVIFADVPAWTRELDTQIAFLAQRAYMGIAATSPNAEIGMQFWNWLLEQMREKVGEARTFVGTLRVNREGVLVDGRATFDTDGKVARYLRSVRKPGRDLLRGLPAGRHPLVMAFEWEERPDTPGINEAFSQVFLRMDTLRERVGAARLESVIEKSNALNRKVPGSSLVYSMRPGGGLLYWGYYLTPQGKTVQHELRELCEMAPEVMNTWGTFPAAVAPGVREQVAGVACDVYQFDLATEQAPVQPVMRTIYGTAPAFYLAEHELGLAYAFGARPAARECLAALLADGGAKLSDAARVRELFARFSPEPQCCVVVDVPAAVAGVSDILEPLGVPIPKMEAEEEGAALAGFTFYLEDAALRAEVFVPAEPVRVLLRTFRDSQQVIAKP